jgi:transcriptional regulator with XRE-family HTH domain
VNKENTAIPFKDLGQQLKLLRTRAQETLAEASGAVEIDVRQLASIELGQTRPTEDVLLLLISHFGAKDDEAVKLWEMAGYGLEKIPLTHMANNEVIMQPQVSNSNQILFTDVVDVVVNNYGVVMNFMQTGGPNNPPSAVARVGMSREHAKSVMQILQATLSQTEPNVLKKTAKPDMTSESPKNN